MSRMKRAWGMGGIFVENRMKDTGMKLTADQIQAVKDNVGEDETPQQQIHRYAICLGLAPISGFYECDLETGALYQL